MSSEATSSAGRAKKDWGRCWAGATTGEYLSVRDKERIVNRLGTATRITTVVSVCRCTVSVV